MRGRAQVLQPLMPRQSGAKQGVITEGDLQGAPCPAELLLVVTLQVLGCQPCGKNMVDVHGLPPPFVQKERCHKVLRDILLANSTDIFEGGSADYHVGSAHERGVVPVLTRTNGPKEQDLLRPSSRGDGVLCVILIVLWRLHKS